MGENVSLLIFPDFATRFLKDFYYNCSAEAEYDCLNVSAVCT